MKSVYVYEAIRRAKDNAEGDPYKNGCFREVCWNGDEEETICRLIEKTSRKPGVWRVYRTVNRRDVRKTQIELIKTLVDMVAGDNTTTKSPESLWKTLLCQPRNKAERRWLLDCDVDNPLPPAISSPLITVQEISKTPNGWAFICAPFDPTKVSLPGFAEIKKDALLFIKRYEV